MKSHLVTPFPQSTCSISFITDNNDTISVFSNKLLSPRSNSFLYLLSFLHLHIFLLFLPSLTPYFCISSVSYPFSFSLSLFLSFSLSLLPDNCFVDVFFAGNVDIISINQLPNLQNITITVIISNVLVIK